MGLGLRAKIRAPKLYPLYSSGIMKYFQQSALSFRHSGPEVDFIKSGCRAESNEIAHSIYTLCLRWTFKAEKASQKLGVGRKPGYEIDPHPGWVIGQ